MRRNILVALMLVVAIALCISCKREPTLDQLAYSEYMNDIFPGYEETGIPVIRINTPDNKTITRDSYIENATFQIVTDVEDAEIPIKIKGRGNYSWWFSNKKGYNIKFDSKTSVLGMAGAKKWCMIANDEDTTLLRNWLVSHLANSVLDNEEWSPSYEYFDLILNGQYMGTYAMAEAVQINKNRLNIKSIEDFEESEFNKGGFILEVDFKADAKWYFYSSTCKLPFTLKDPDLEDIDATAHVNHMKSIIDAVEAELSAPDFAEKSLSDISTIDVDSFIDWYIIEEFAKNLDADFFSSVFIYYDPSDQRIHMGPHWDADHSFGNYKRTKSSTDEDCASPEGFWINTTQASGGTSWYEYLLANDAFVDALKERWCGIRGSFAGSYSAIDAAIDAKATTIEKSATYNFMKWKHMGTNIFYDHIFRNSVSNFKRETESLKDWIKKRYVWLDAQWGN